MIENQSFIFRRDRDSAALRLRYLDALPRGRLNEEWHTVTAFPLSFSAVQPLRKQVFDGPAIKKAPQLRCDAIP